MFAPWLAHIKACVARSPRRSRRRGDRTRLPRRRPLLEVLEDRLPPNNLIALGDATPAAASEVAPDSPAAPAEITRVNGHTPERVAAPDATADHKTEVAARPFDLPDAVEDPFAEGPFAVSSLSNDPEDHEDAASGDLGDLALAANLVGPASSSSLTETSLAARPGLEFAANNYLTGNAALLDIPRR